MQMELNLIDIVYIYNFLFTLLVNIIIIIYLTLLNKHNNLQLMIVFGIFILSKYLNIKNMVKINDFEKEINKTEKNIVELMRFGFLSILLFISYLHIKKINKYMFLLLVPDALYLSLNLSFKLKLIGHRKN